MLRDQILVRAKIRLYLNEDGGRQTGIKSGYWPNHAFEKPELPNLLKAYIGEIQFDKPDIILPGESAEVNVAFLEIDEIKRYIKVGQKWFIYEGSGRLYGEGEIISI